ncbi:Retrovirus-related Pol polyprotein from transposon TNT 1-94 [Gossypium australe]|uniref:Retrovirus-related Pol polyprotein from transposon TNT 1-94 n=1 Tax=Gossypium australe TaxID=47621 RepID=A0A5B6VVX7_9ROSI|nr:Retrovirus-related Pol polyprotein from transposon TNT 1-94 [Gossypium australe]
MKDKGKLLQDATKFRLLVGSLIYLTITRPKIVYSVGVVSQFMQCPRSTHLDAAKRILCYVKGSIDYGLMYGRSENFALRTDVDSAGDANSRHSTSGYCFNIGSAMISWCSKKQNMVSVSSTEAEYVAATVVAHECMCLRSLMGDMLCKVQCDNEIVVKLASNPIFHAQTKHIEVRRHYI